LLPFHCLNGFDIILFEMMNYLSVYAIDWRKELPNQGTCIDEPVRVILIGAGFSGIGIGHKLKDEGMNNFIILERAKAVGGTVSITLDICIFLYCRVLYSTYTNA
jgi:heterodisulfide reductase subunit A-like polyferredoxin